LKTQVNHKILGNFFKYDQAELDFSEVTYDVSIHDKEYCVAVILKYFRQYGFPYYTVTDIERYKHMKQLCEFDTDNILKDDDRIEQTMHTLRLAWSYFPHSWEVKCGKSKMSPMDVFNDDDEFKKTIGKCYDWCVKHDDGKMSMNRIRQSLKIYNGISSVSNFRPTAAKYIYDTYSGDGVVWDMSCGWGGRLLGALASKKVKKYIGTEPSSKTFEGLLNIKSDFKYLYKKIELHKMGSELFTPEENSLDLCFTSPPYFDTEKYSDELTQSYLKYPSEDRWIDGFLYDTISNCYCGLKKGGYMLMNIANTSSGTSIENATTQISEKIGFRYIKTLKLTLSSIAGKGQKYEPVFVFKK